MKTTRMLEVLTTELGAMTPAIGLIRHTLLSKFEPGEVAAETRFLDPRIDPKNQVIKFWVVFPDEMTEERHTTGRPGYSLGEQDFVVSGFVQVREEGGSELILQEDFDAVIARLRMLTRMKEADGTDTEAVHLGRFRVSGIDRIKVGATLCHFKTLRLTVQERRLAN